MVLEWILVSQDDDHGGGDGHLTTGMLKVVRSNIFMSEGRVFEEGGGKYLAVAFRGQSFLYNQIRLMIGSALAAVTGLLPEEAMDAALLSPYMVYSPLAPAEGLYLRRLTFGRQTKSTVLLDDKDKKELIGGWIGDEDM